MLVLKVFNKELNNKLDQRDLDRQRGRENIPFKVAECIFFSSTFLQIGHMLSYKTSSGRFKKFEIISNLFSNENVMILVINCRQKFQNKETPTLT